MKLKNTLNNMFNSVFSKLLITLIVTGILINIAVILFFRFGFSDIYRKPFRQSIIEHIHYLVEDLGSPPDREQAAYVALKAGFDIFYKNKNESWTTSPQNISFDELRIQLDVKCLGNHIYRKHFLKEIKKTDERRKHLISFLEKRLLKEVDENEIKKVKKRLFMLKKAPIIKIGLINKRMTALYETENESIIFYKSNIFSDKSTIAFIILLSVLTVIISIAYFLIRKTLKPIKSLTSGVENVSQGNLSFQIPSYGKDELGKLSGAFNEMTQQIKKMLHSKEELLIDISHELRSPITRVKVAMEFLPESETRKNIHDDIVEIETMINELLESARLDTEHGRPVMKKTGIRDMLKNIIDLDLQYRKYVKIEKIPEDLTLTFDPEQIKTVIKNILDNGIKYTKSKNHRIVIKLKQEKKHTIIEISDNGIGIPEKELPYIFEPFYRVDKSRSKKTGGYGLGLNLCKNIMEAHGGKIEARSFNMEGTTVFLRFQND